MDLSQLRYLLTIAQAGSLSAAAKRLQVSQPTLTGAMQRLEEELGSTLLVFQTLLPSLLSARGPSSLQLCGGTHNVKAPPFEFIEQCFLPLIQSMGVDVTVALERPGFMQAGGGVLKAEIWPIKKWKKLKLTERGERGLSWPGLGERAHVDLVVLRDLSEVALEAQRRMLEAEATQVVGPHVVREPRQVVVDHAVHRLPRLPVRLDEKIEQDVEF